MTTFAWHVHHETLVEPLTEPIENRIAYIKEYKPASQVELRLRLLKPVQGELPAALNKAKAARDKAFTAYAKARAALDKAWAAYDKARAALDKAWAAYMPEIEALHAIECPDCPWDGTTIFPSAGGS